MKMTRESGETFAAQWAEAWNRRAIEAVLEHFHQDVVFSSPTALAVVGSPVVRGKEALRAYWTAALARITSLSFTVDHVVWDPLRRELAIIYSSDIDGQSKRVSENLTFDEHGQVVAAEVFHGGAAQRERGPSQKTDQDDTHSPIKALGEVAFRVNNLPQMKRFYQQVLGLEVLGEFPTAVLLKIAKGYGGHTQVLGLFDRSVPVGPERSTVDHIAFTIGLEDYESEKARLEGLGLTVEVKDHEWVQWRSLYFYDPEGNEVELVCFDPSVGPQPVH